MKPYDKPAKRAAVNIEKIEEGLESVEFEPVELPEPELEASGGEAEERKEILQDLEKEVKRDDPFKPFQALKLEDLFGDDYVPLREKDPSLPLLPDNAAYTIHVGEPIFPDPALSVRENAGAMREKNAAFTRAVYEETYGKPLCYLCEEK